MNWQECNVVMLPTEKTIDYPFLGLYYDNGKQSLVYVVSNTTNSALTQPQHLYITNSKEKIKEGDWVYGLLNGTYGIFQFINKSGYGTSDSRWKKIIATTDESLGYTDHRVSLVPNFCELPRPSDDFLKKYCELGGIGEVLVEYDEVKVVKLTQELFNQIGGHTSMVGYPVDRLEYNLKIAPDNTITIKPIKNRIRL